jgi:hypothetical protein
MVPQLVMILSLAILFSSSTTTTSILHPRFQSTIARQRKVEAIENYPRPINKKQLKSYLGMANYYRKFIRNFSRIAAPLYALLRASMSFEWATEQELETKGEINIKTNFVIPGFHERIHTNYRCEQ